MSELPAATARRDALGAIRLLIAGLTRSARAIEQRTGVTNAQLFLLQQLSRNPALSVNDLASLARTNQSTVSIVVGRLVKAGLVRKARSEVDARSAVLTLTPAGRRLLRRAPKPPTARLLDAIESLHPSEARRLASGLRALIRALGLDTAEPGLLFEESTPPARRR